MTRTPTPLRLPKHGETIIFADCGFVGMGLIKNGKAYLIEHRKRGKLRFIWEGGRSVDWDAYWMRDTQWEVVQA